MKLLDQVRHALRVKHFSYRTEQAYVHGIERYIRHHGIRHPSTMGTAEVEQFLTHLAVEGRVAARRTTNSPGSSCSRAAPRFRACDAGPRRRCVQKAAARVRSPLDRVAREEFHKVNRASLLKRNRRVARQQSLSR